MHRALSPQDLEELAAPAVLRIGEYVAAERDEVDLTIDAAGHIRGVTDELQVLMRETGGYDLLHEQELETRSREAADDALARGEDPSGWMLYLFGSGEDASDGMVRVVTRTLTAEWLAVQVDQALDELTAYLVGESDGLEIRIRLDDAQAEIALEEIKAVLREADSYDLLYTGVVERPVEDRLGASVELPYGVEITSDEVVSALRQAASPAWVQQQAERLIDDASAYVTGRSDGFSTEISLTRNKEEAASVLTEMAGAKVAEVLASLPVCLTRADALAARNTQGQVLPACIPPGVSVSDVSAELGPPIADSIPTFVLAPVPDAITFTESRLRSALEESGGPEVLGSFDELRKMSGEGWTYNQDDLRDDLFGRGNAIRLLDETRSFLSDGYFHTPQNISGGDSDDPVRMALDRVRGLSETVRRYEWAAYLAAPVLLVIIGLLLGTTWSGRVAWPALVLLLATAVVSILSWPVYEAVADGAFEQARSDAAVQTGGPFDETSRLVAAKSIDVAEAVTDEFVGGIRKSSVTLAVVAFVVLLTALSRRRIVEVVGPPLQRLFHRRH